MEPEERSLVHDVVNDLHLGHPRFKPAGALSNQDFWAPWKKLARKKLEMELPDQKKSRTGQRRKVVSAETIQQFLIGEAEKSIGYYGCFLFDNRGTRDSPQSTVLGVTGLNICNLFAVALHKDDPVEFRWVLQVSHGCGNSYCLIHVPLENEPYNHWRNDCQKYQLRACPHHPKCHLDHGGHKMAEECRMSGEECGTPEEIAQQRSEFIGTLSSAKALQNIQFCLDNCLGSE